MRALKHLRPHHLKMAKINKTITYRQPEKNRLPSLLTTKKRARKNGRHAKNINLHIPHVIHLSISLRQFRTNKDKRSKVHKQFVVHTYGIFYQEISLKLLTKRRKQYTFYKFNLPASQVSLPILTIVGIVGIFYFSLNLTSQKYLEPTVKAYNSPVQSTTPKPISLEKSEPTKLRIPKIEVNTSIISIGLRGDGTLDVPTAPDLVGWYTGSPTPGEIGPSVIDGHVDSPNGIAIFWRLGELQMGDVIEIDKANSITAKFKVDRVAQYPQDNFPTDEVYGNLNYAGIRLITCSGTFDTSTHRYSHNTIVFGSLLP